MQEMGLEPTRYCYHRHLKPARLPIPPLLRTNDILSNFLKYVNRKNNLKKSKNLLTIVASFAIITESLTDMRQIQMRGSVGTGRRARLRILWSLRSCGFKSHLPHTQSKGFIQMDGSFCFRAEATLKKKPCFQDFFHFTYKYFFSKSSIFIGFPK